MSQGKCCFFYLISSYTDINLIQFGPLSKSTKRQKTQIQIVKEDKLLMSWEWKGQFATFVEEGLFIQKTKPRENTATRSGYPSCSKSTSLKIYYDHQYILTYVTSLEYEDEDDPFNKAWPIVSTLYIGYEGIS